MAKLKDLATNHPAYFSLLTIAAFFLFGGLFVFLATLISGASYSDPLVDSFGSLATIFMLFIVTWRLLWLRPMGVAYLGKWPAWHIALSPKAIAEPDWSLSGPGMVGAILLQIPLVLLGLWLQQRRGPRLTVPYVT